VFGKWDMRREWRRESARRKVRWRNERWTCFSVDVGVEAFPWSLNGMLPCSMFLKICATLPRGSDTRVHAFNATKRSNQRKNLKIRSAFHYLGIYLP
jgi:hypothetical protein